MVALEKGTIHSGEGPVMYFRYGQFSYYMPLGHKFTIPNSFIRFLYHPVDSLTARVFTIPGERPYWDNWVLSNKIPLFVYSLPIRLFVTYSLTASKSPIRGLRSSPELWVHGTVYFPFRLVTSPITCISSTTNALVVETLDMLTSSRKKFEFR